MERKTVIMPAELHGKLWNLNIKESGIHLKMSMQAKIDFLIQFYLSNKK